MKENRNQFDEDPVYTAAFNALKDKYRSAQKGDLIPYRDIEAVVRFERDTKEGAYLLGKFKRWLSRNFVVRCEPCVGVRLLTDEEAQMHAPVHRFKKGGRQIKRLIREIGNIEGANLGDHQRRSLNMAMEQACFQRLIIGRAKRAYEKENYRTETLPKRAK